MEFMTEFSKRDDYNAMDFNYKYLHYHNFHEVYFLLEGSRSYMIDDELIYLNKGDCVIISSGALHKTFGGIGFERFLIYFTDDYIIRHASKAFADTIKQHIFAKKKISFSPNDFYKLRVLLKSLHGEKSDFERYAIFLNVVSLLKNNSSNRISNDDSGLTNDIANFVNAHFKEITSLGDVSDEFLISDEHLCRIFKQRFGISFMTYLNTCKIKYACSILTEHNLTVTEAAIESGFNSSNYFCRVFKRVVGVTPKEYKNTTAKI